MSTDSASFTCTSGTSLWGSYLGEMVCEIKENPFDINAPIQDTGYSLDIDDENSFIQQLGISYEELVAIGFYTGGTEDTPEMPDPNSLSPEVFSSWHSQLQLAYIYEYIKDVPIYGANGNNGVLTIGTQDNQINVTISSMQTTPRPTYIIPSNPGNKAKIVVLENLTVENIVSFTEDDLSRLWGLHPADVGYLPNEFTHPAFIDFITRNGLIASFTQPGVNQTTEFKDPNSPLAKLVYFELEDWNKLVGTPFASLEHLIGDEIEGISDIAQKALNAITAQIEIFLTDILGEKRYLNDKFLSRATAYSKKVFSPEQIYAKAQELLDSIEVLCVFAKTLRNKGSSANFNAAPWEVQYSNLAASFNNLTQAEIAKSNVLQAANAISSGTATSLQGSPLSAPQSISMFIYGLSLKLQAQNQFDTERFNQLNTLIKSYGVMQRLINKTLDNFKGDELGDSGLVKDGKNTIEDLNLSDEGKGALHMFDANGSHWANPVETLENVTRPLLDLLQGEYPATGITIEYDRQQWTTMLQQVNDAVTLLNQNSQLQFNEITTRSQRRTVFFEAASDALVKLEDILVSMARNTV